LHRSFDACCAASRKHELTYNDLIALPLGVSKPTIVWLRLYLRANGAVAIVTEVPGNPGMSVTNDISRIRDFIVDTFHVASRELTFYEVWPKGVGYVPPSWQRVRFEPDPIWHRATRAQVERRLSGAMPLLPEHDELYARVIAMGGGGTYDVYQRVFENVATDRLPEPHPFRCSHMQGPDDSGSDLKDTTIHHPTMRDASLCGYHKMRWREIADESVRIVQALGRRDPEDYMSAAEMSPLSTPEREWLWSLFHDPIDISNDGGYVNGQHRACAIRFSGAAGVAVVTRYEVVGQACDDWTYGGNG
jgi:hypothetical protein